MTTKKPKSDVIRRIEIDNDIHHKFKKYCVSEKISMKSQNENLITNFLAKESNLQKLQFAQPNKDNQC